MGSKQSETDFVSGMKPPTQFWEMKMKTCVSFVFCVVAGLFVGCSQDASTPKGSTPKSSNAVAVVDGSKYLLSEEPKGAEAVIKVREESKNEEDVVIVGRIGGSENPWIEGRAAFSIVDGSLKACSDVPGDECETPWDYCCETHKLPTSTALVKVVDENGDLVNADARQLLKVQELSTVVVKGTAQRDDAGNLTVLASGVYVRK